MNHSTIFLLENDDDTRPLFQKILEDKGYNVVLAVNEKDALQRINDGLIKSDIIIVNLLGKSETEMLAFGTLLREKAKLKVPVLAVAAKYGEELEGTIAQAGENEYIVYLGAGGELFDLLSNLIK